MKLRGEWLVLAERVINDSLGGNLTLVSCLYQVAAIQFPAQHHGFGVAGRFRCVGEPPKKPTRASVRLVRSSDADPEETVQEWDITWAPGTRCAHVGTNFQILRLRRPETVEFRVDHRIGRGAWQHGPTCSLDVLPMVLTDEQREAIRAELVTLGLPEDALHR